MNISGFHYFSMIKSLTYPSSYCHCVANGLPSHLRDSQFHLYMLERSMFLGRHVPGILRGVLMKRKDHLCFDSHCLASALQVSDMCDHEDQG